MMKIFVSQPMRGKSFQEVEAVRMSVADELRERFDQPIEIVDNLNRGAELWFDGQHDIISLANSLLMLARADVVVMYGDWNNYRGCRIENQVAKDYGKKVYVLDMDGLHEVN